MRFKGTIFLCTKKNANEAPSLLFFCHLLVTEVLVVSWFYNSRQGSNGSGPLELSNSVIHHLHVKDISSLLSLGPNNTP